MVSILRLPSSKYHRGKVNIPFGKKIFSKFSIKKDPQLLLSFSVEFSTIPVNGSP